MDLVWGVVAGGLIGWCMHRFTTAGADQGLRACLLIGALGGGVGAQIASLIGWTSAADGGFNLLSMFAAAAAAAGCLIASRMIANRGNA